MEDIEQELMKLECRHKKDIVEAERRLMNGLIELMEDLTECKSNLMKRKPYKSRHKQTQAHLNHITKLTGISFEKFADIESRIENAANALQPQAESR